jgi:hypothetical protein
MSNLSPLAITLHQCHAVGGWERVAAEVEGMVATWRPISEAPQTGERFVAAARILRTGTRELLYWQTDVWWFDEGEFKTDSDNGIWFDDCEVCFTLPPPPAAGETRVADWIRDV